MPVGAHTISLVVNSKGLPAFVQHEKPNNVFSKLESGEWSQLNASGTWQIAYGKNDTLYRIDWKGRFLVLNGTTGEWKTLVRNKSPRIIGASFDALWIIELETRIPYKFDEETQKFIE